MHVRRRMPRHSISVELVVEYRQRFASAICYMVRANATLLEENITELALKWDVSIHVSSRL